jgi:hypothetical protein
VYVVKDKFKENLFWEWSIDFFRKNYLNKYINEIIPRELEEFNF